MNEAVDLQAVPKRPKSNWWWPAVVASSFASATAVAAFRGCWHGKMSWPVSAQGCCYQVCLKCGAKRLFDENRFRAYGPFRNSLGELLTWERSTKRQLHPEAKMPDAAP